MQLFQVWDKKGEPFEVLPAVAKRLIITDGWSPTAPTKTAETSSVVSPVVEKTPEPEPIVPTVIRVGI